MKRYLEDAVRADLDEKMVFLGGPRQVGKTTLALALLGNGTERHPAYLNWDDVATRKMLIQGALPGNESLVVLDECKSGERNPSRNISYFAERTPIPCFYQVHMGGADFEVAGVRARVLPLTTLAVVLGV